jgi:hypothetical protein
MRLVSGVKNWGYSRVERKGETLDFSNAEAPLAMLAHSPLTSVRKYGTILALSPKRMTI